MTIGTQGSLFDDYVIPKDALQEHVRKMIKKARSMMPGPTVHTDENSPAVTGCRAIKATDAVSVGKHSLYKKSQTVNR